MDSRAQELIHTLRLSPHPEGGAFREVFRAAGAVSEAGGGSRPSATHIYFLLVAGEHSRWHRVAQEEVWHLYEGDALELAWITQDWSRIERRTLGTVGPGCEPTAVVPAGHWQTATTTGRYTLAGCTVTPGFDFADFVLLSDDPEATSRLRRQFPEAERFLFAATP